MKLGKFLVSCLPVLLLLASASAQSSYAGWIEEIHGQTYWKSSSGGMQLPLDVHNDQYKRLYVGEAVRCRHGATLELRIYGSLQLVTEKAGWYRVPKGPEAPYALPYGTRGGKQASIRPEDAFAAQKLLTAYSRRFDEISGGGGGMLGAIGGHRARATGMRGGAGTSHVIFSPGDGSYVFAGNVVFRWVPTPLSRVNLVVEDGNGNLLWREDDVDGALGELVSESARKVLSDHRDQRTPTHFRFVIVDKTGSKASVTFSVLSVNGEEAVKNELAKWDGQQTVLQHLGRALVFREQGMSVDVAQEYDAALASAPESTALSNATVLVHREAGMWRSPVPADAQAK